LATVKIIDNKVGTVEVKAFKLGRTQLKRRNSLKNILKTFTSEELNVVLGVKAKPPRFTVWSSNNFVNRRPIGFEQLSANC
jgi:hypothetical protein